MFSVLFDSSDVKRLSSASPLASVVELVVCSRAQKSEEESLSCYESLNVRNVEK